MTRKNKGCVSSWQCSIFEFMRHFVTLTRCLTEFVCITMLVDLYQSLRACVSGCVACMWWYSTIYGNVFLSLWSATECMLKLFAQNKDTLWDTILNMKWLFNNTITFQACVYEVPACFPPHLYDMTMFVHRLSHDLWHFAPTDRAACIFPDESWMCDVMCLACSDSSVSLLSIPLHKLRKVEHRWVRQHYSLNCSQCSPIPLYPMSPLAFYTSPCVFLLSLPESPLHFLLVFFPSLQQQIKKSTTTTLVSATCLTWQQEALYPCMFSNWPMSRWVQVLGLSVQTSNYINAQNVQQYLFSFLITADLYLYSIFYSFLFRSIAIAAFTPSTLPYLVPALRAPALMTPGHLVQIAFTPEYFSLREDYANEPLTSLRLLLLWVSRCILPPGVPGRKSPELGTGFSRSCWDSQQLLLKPSE